MNNRCALHELLFEVDRLGEMEFYPRNSLVYVDQKIMGKVK